MTTPTPEQIAHKAPDMTTPATPAVPPAQDEWLKEATRLADEAVCLGTPHKTNVAYAALLSHLAARPVGALSEKQRNAIADRVFAFFCVPPREREEGLAAYIIQFTEEALAASAPVGALSLSDAQLVGAIARGWCHPANSSKEMDADLAGAICEEVRAILAASAPAPTDDEIRAAWNRTQDPIAMVRTLALAPAVNALSKPALDPATVEACAKECERASSGYWSQLFANRIRALASAPAVPQAAPKMVLLTESEIDEALAPYVFHDRFGIVPAIQRAFAAKNGLEIDRLIRAAHENTLSAIEAPAVPQAAVDVLAERERQKSQEGALRNDAGYPIENPDQVCIRYERGGRWWHTNCANHFGGVMRVLRNEEKRSLIECLHCGQQGYYPVGGVGEVCAERLDRAAAKGEK